MRHADALHESLASRELIGRSTLNVHKNFAGKNMSVAREGMFMPTGLRTRWNFHQDGRDFGIGGASINDGLPSRGYCRPQKRSDLDLLFIALGLLRLRTKPASSPESLKEEISPKPS
jgi:hypothetical protein